MRPMWALHTLPLVRWEVFPEGEGRMPVDPSAIFTWFPYSSEEWYQGSQCQPKSPICSLSGQGSAIPTVRLRFYIITMCL